MASTSLDALAVAADVTVRERNEAIASRRRYACGCRRGSFHTDACIADLDDKRSHAYRAGYAYFGALRDQSFTELRRVESSLYSRRDEDKAHSRLKAAREHLRLLKQVGPDLRLESEWLHAQAMEERFEMIWGEYIEKRSALTEARKARRVKRAPITDGRVIVGYRTIDGVRVPITETVK